MLEGREALTNELQRQLAVFAGYLSLAGQNNLSSSHVAAEATAKGLLNQVYGWELVNANTISQNYPGVDLIDADNNIAVQVTANQTVKKIKDTLEKVGKRGVVYSRLIVLFLTNDKPTQTMRECRVPVYSGPVEVWNLGDVLRDAKELDPVILSALTEYMESELGTIKDRVKELPHLELPPAGGVPPTGFVGRGEELAEIRSRFQRGDKEVVLTGLGGMGKTELAARYGQEHPGMVHFVRFDTNFTRTIEKMVYGIRPKLHDEELKLEGAILRKKVLDMLGRSGSDDLLIIDNADNPSGSLADLQKDEGYRLLRELPLKLLLTTRSEAPRAIEVRPMAEEPLSQIFENHGAELAEQARKDLIAAVNGHTLTIDLIARTLNGRGWRKVTPDKMLTALRDRTLPSQKYRKIATDYNQSTEQAQIYEHLSVVFDMSGMSGLLRKVMRCASLLPDGGMDSELFGTSLDEEEQDALDDLLYRGWLEVRHELLTIHPVIRLVCLEELKPTDEDCGAFLDRLWAQFDRKNYLQDQYAQMAELFTEAHDRFGKHHGRWLNRSGIIWNELGQDQTLHDLYHVRLPALEQALAPDSKELATAYNYYGIAFGALGRYHVSLAYYEKALAIREKVLPENDPDLARSYNNVGNAHGNLGDYRKELEYKLNAMAIFEEVLPADDPDLATSYIHVGSAYGNLGDHKRALEFKLKAMEIRQKVFPSDHPNLAASYNNVGSTYGELGDHKRALEFYLKAMEICETVLPAGHLDLADSYNNIGLTYSNLGDHKRALEYALKALEIREKVSPADHPNLAASYNNIGLAYGNLGDHKQALRFKLKALEIQKKVLPANHPNLATSYSNVGYTYGELGDTKRALELNLTAMEIREMALPADHPDLATSYNNVGGAYTNLGDYKQALEYQMKALLIQKKVLSEDHPLLALTHSNIAWEYHELRNLTEAARYMRRAADIISRSTLPKTHPHRVNLPKFADQFEREAEMEKKIKATMQGFGTLPPIPPFGKK